MKIGLEIIILILSIIAIFIYFYKKFLKKNFFLSRTPLSFEKIYSTLGKKEDIDFQIFKETFEKLGECYSVDPKYIRPNDSVKMFLALDSWNLNYGTEKMDDWLEKRFNLSCKNENISTVLDLLHVIKTSEITGA